MVVSRWLRYRYVKLLRIDDTPGKIAMGMAVGVFLGILPTFGVGTVLALALAFIFRFNKAAAVLGTLIMNPLTTPLFWGTSAILGTVLIGGDWQQTVQAVEAFYRNHGGLTLRSFLPWELWRVILGTAKESLYAYFVGNLLISALFAALAYFLTIKVTTTYQKRKASLLARKEQ